jgi:CheY-like chemotaxis protein
MLTRMVGEDVEISIDLDPALGHVRADRAQMEQILANLVVNARDAMPSGGRVSIATRQIRLDGNAAALGVAPGEYVRICVADTGSGMSEETAATAFEPFFTTKGDGRGTGLGLATVHGIAVQSGGAVKIHSVLDEGTMICIHLPAVGDALPDRALDATTVEVRGGGECVLLVEDEPVVRRLVSSLLEAQGYDVTPVANGAAACELANGDASFDLLVTDYVLPDLNGHELASRLVASGAVRGVLYISGYAPETEFVSAPAQVPTSFLQKPFSRDELARSVRGLLDAGDVK